MLKRFLGSAILTISSFRNSGYFLRGSYEVKVNLRVPTACCCALWIDNNQSTRVQQTPACLSTGCVILSPCRSARKIRIMFQSLYFSFRMWWKTCYPGAPPLSHSGNYTFRVQLFSFFFDSTGRDESDWIKPKNTYCPLRDGCHAVWAFPSLRHRHKFLIYLRKCTMNIV